MNTTSTTSTVVLIAGASGNVGQQVTRHIAQTGGQARAGLRGGSAHPAADALLRIDGVEVVELDLTAPASLAPAVEGVDVVVSAIQGGPELLIDGQEALAGAAQAAGARRIFPSAFGADFSAIPHEDHLFFSWRRQAQEAIAATGLAQTNTYNGAFLEMLLPQPMLVLLDRENARMNYWGSAEQTYDFTAIDDVARYIAAAAQDPSAPEGPLRLAGDSRSPAQIAQIATRVTGRAFSLEQLGSLADLTAEIDRRQEAAPQAPMAWVGLQYFRPMASGAGQLHDTHNHHYPSVVPATIEEFLTRHDF